MRVLGILFSIGLVVALVVMAIIAGTIRSTANIASYKNAQANVETAKGRAQATIIQANADAYSQRIRADIVYRDFEANLQAQQRQQEAQIEAARLKAQLAARRDTTYMIITAMVLVTVVILQVAHWNKVVQLEARLKPARKPRKQQSRAKSGGFV